MIKKVIVAMLLIAVLAIPANAIQVDNFNGIPGNEQTPPIGTIIDEQLSMYYNMPIATSEDTMYFYLMGFWYSTEDFFNLPYSVFMYGSFPSNHANVPISGITFVSIIGALYFVSIRIRKQ